MSLVDVLDALKNRGMRALGRYYGLYRARVVDNDDPERRGRIVVDIPGIRLQVWAHPAMWGGKDYGVFNPPEKGDCVYVMFEDGDVRAPIYFGGWYAKNELPDEFAGNYPKVRGIKTKAGHRIVIDDKNNFVEITTAGGRSVKIDDANDKIVLNNKGKKQIVIKGDNVLIGGETATQPLILSWRLITWLLKLYTWTTAVGSMIGMPPQSVGLEAPDPNSMCNMKHKQTTD